MNLPVELHPAALEEALAAKEWYRQRSEAASLNIAKEIEKAVNAIQDFPERWPLFGKHARRILLARFPFGLIYRIESNRILILAFAHERRKPDYWRDR